MNPRTTPKPAPPCPHQPCLHRADGLGVTLLVNSGQATPMESGQRQWALQVTLDPADGFAHRTTLHISFWFYRESRSPEQGGPYARASVTAGLWSCGTRVPLCLLWALSVGIRCPPDDVVYTQHSEFCADVFTPFHLPMLHPPGETTDSPVVGCPLAHGRSPGQ